MMKVDYCYVTGVAFNQINRCYRLLSRVQISRKQLIAESKRLVTFFFLANVIQPMLNLLNRAFSFNATIYIKNSFFSIFVKNQRVNHYGFSYLLSIYLDFD